MTKLLTLLFVVCCGTIAFSQTTFKSNRWFDIKKYPISEAVEKPVVEPSSVAVYDDKIEVALGNQLLSYAIKAKKEDPKSKAFRYTVVKDGVESILSIRQGPDEAKRNGGRERIMISNDTEFEMLVYFTDVQPEGIYLPGMPRVDVTESTAFLVDGYWDVDYAQVTNKSPIDNCLTDIFYEFRPDNTGTIKSGASKEECTDKTELAVKWKLADLVVKGKHLLKLAVGPDTIDTKEYTVVALTKNSMTLHGDINLGGDSGEAAYIYLSKKKSKKK